MRAAYTPPLPGSETALLERLARRSTQQAIHNIAMADYGHGAEIVPGQLRKIFATRTIPPEVGFETEECCSLISNHFWSGPDETVTLFCAAGVWLRMWPMKDRFGYLLAPYGRLARLTYAALLLGHEDERATLEYFCWLARNVPDPEYTPRSFVALPIVLLQASLLDERASRRSLRAGVWRPEVGAVRRQAVALEELVDLEMDEMRSAGSMLNLRPHHWFLSLDDEQREDGSWIALCELAAERIPMEPLPELGDVVQRIRSFGPPLGP